MTDSPKNMISYDEALKEIAEELAEFFKDDPKKIAYWLMTPNPLLGNVVPAWLMLARLNGPEKLLAFVRNCKEGNLP